MTDFSYLKPGDTITRLLGGKISMKMVVREVGDTLLTCDAIDKDSGKLFRGGWTFDRKTGTEEDHELGWGVKFGVTGSFLVKGE